MYDSMWSCIHLKISRALEFQLLVFLIEDILDLFLALFLRFAIQFRNSSFYFFLTWLLQVPIMILEHAHQITHIEL